MFLLCEDGGDSEEHRWGLVVPVSQMLGQDIPLYLEYWLKISRGAEGGREVSG